MNTSSQGEMVAGASSGPASAEQRLEERGIKLTAPPEPFGAYVEKEIHREANKIT